ncbi:MAG: head-tail connector protein [Asticcacaulis sp.]
MLDVVVLTTGPLLDLDMAKNHLRVQTDADDALIEAYADAAVLSCLKACNKTLVPVGAEPVFRAAALMLLGDLYANREAVVAGQTFSLSPTIDRLLHHYRVYGA